MRIVKTLFFACFLAAALGSSAFAQISGHPREEHPGTPSSVDLSKSVTIYPNPAVEYLHVKFEEPIAAKSKLTVHNIIGNVLDIESEMVDEHEVRLRVKDLPVGYYVLAVRDDQSNARSTIKFLKR